MDHDLEAQATKLHHAAHECEDAGEMERGKILRCAADLVSEAARDSERGMPLQRVISVADRVTAILR